MTKPSSLLPESTVLTLWVHQCSFFIQKTSCQFYSCIIVHLLSWFTTNLFGSRVFNHQQVVLSNQASALYLIHLKLFLGGVHKLRLQDEVVLEISTVCRFALLTVKKFLHEFQHGVGRWSKRPKSCQRSWRMPPYSFLNLERFVVGENGSFCMSQRVKVNSEEKILFWYNLLPLLISDKILAWISRGQVRGQLVAIWKTNIFGKFF